MISKDVDLILNSVFQNAVNSRHEYITIEHMLYAIVNDRYGKEILLACGADLAKLEAELKDNLENAVPKVEGERKIGPVPTMAFMRVVQTLVMYLRTSGRKSLDAGDMLAALFDESDSFAVHFLSEQDITKLDVLDYVSNGIENYPDLLQNNKDEYQNKRAKERAKEKEKEKANENENKNENENENEAENEDDDEKDDDSEISGRIRIETILLDGDREREAETTRNPLKNFAVCLNDEAANGAIDPLVGRLNEINRAIVVLNRRRKNNVIFVGEPGVGKTALVEGIALKIYNNEVPEALKGVKIYALDVGALVAGAKYRGDFEARLRGVIKKLEKIPGVILFIDEIHTLVGTGETAGGGVDAAGLLKPALSSGRFRCIGTTTFEEYKNFDKDRAFSRRFQKIDLCEPSVKETYKILLGLKSVYEKFHGVTFTSGALKAAAKLSARYIREQFLPDKAIDVIDEAATILKLKHVGKKSIVKKSLIEKAVAKIARVPSKRISASDLDKLKNLQTELQSVIFGQDSAIEALVKAIKIARAGMTVSTKPIGSFLFTGPTGVGKTEAAKQLAIALGVKFLRFDMSEYMEKHAVSRFIGAPPGYVGFDRGGVLTDSIRQYPYAVLLLDEIEKAHEDIFNIMLQIMDYATLTDNVGKKADFRNVIIIMTSNAGAREMAKNSIGFSKNDKDAEWKGKAAIDKLFSPEFRNRLDGIVNFAPLKQEVMVLVVNKFIKELNSQLKERAVSVELDTDAVNWLAEKGYNPSQGARPLGRVIQKEIKNPLSEMILFGALSEGGTALVSKTKGADSLTVSAKS